MGKVAEVLGKKILILKKMGRGGGEYQVVGNFIHLRIEGETIESV